MMMMMMMMIVTVVLAAPCRAWLLMPTSSSPGVINPHASAGKRPRASESRGRDDEEGEEEGEDKAEGCLLKPSTMMALFFTSNLGKRKRKGNKLKTATTTTTMTTTTTITTTARTTTMTLLHERKRSDGSQTITHLSPMPYILSGRRVTL